MNDPTPKDTKPTAPETPIPIGSAPTPPAETPPVPATNASASTADAATSGADSDVVALTLEQFVSTLPEASRAGYAGLEEDGLCFMLIRTVGSVLRTSAWLCATDRQAVQLVQLGSQPVAVWSVPALGRLLGASHVLAMDGAEVALAVLELTERLSVVKVTLAPTTEVFMGKIASYLHSLLTMTAAMGGAATLARLDQPKLNDLESFVQAISAASDTAQRNGTPISKEILASTTGAPAAGESTHFGVYL